MKKISIITCTYNSDEYLSECIESVKKQKLNNKDFEHIFIDGNSKDKTLDIIEKYKNDTSYDISVYKQDPKGVYKAMNLGGEKSVGEYIIFLNSDDWLEEGILGEYIDFIEKTGKKDLYYGDLKLHRGNIIETTNITFLKQLIFKISGLDLMLICHPTVLMKRETFFNVGMFDETKKIASDKGIFLALLSKGGSFEYFPKVVSNFRIHQGSLSTDYVELGYSEVSYFRRKHLPFYKYYLCSIIELYFKFSNYFHSLCNRVRKK